MFSDIRIVIFKAFSPEIVTNYDGLILTSVTKLAVFRLRLPSARHAARHRPRPLQMLVKMSLDFFTKLRRAVQLESFTFKKSSYYRSFHRPPLNIRPSFFIEKLTVESGQYQPFFYLFVRLDSGSRIGDDRLSSAGAGRIHASQGASWT